MNFNNSVTEIFFANKNYDLWRPKSDNRQERETLLIENIVPPSNTNSSKTAKTDSTYSIANKRDSVIISKTDAFRDLFLKDKINNHYVDSFIGFGLKKQTHQKGSTACLMAEFDRAWNIKENRFIFPAFNPGLFANHLVEHAKLFKKQGINNQNHYGFIDKYDLDPSVKGNKIYMRADPHGDLKSVFENIKTLQQQGHLDENFRCKQGVHLVFLGDYGDRGDHGTQILDLLMGLIHIAQ